jgi:hypothetical protein
MKAILNKAMAVFALMFSAVPITAWAADPIVGTWRLVSWSYEETDSKTVHKPFGDHPSGMQTFTPDGWYFVVVTDSTRKPPAGPKATDAEAAQLYRMLAAIAGRYRTEGDKWFEKAEFHSVQRASGRRCRGLSRSKTIACRPSRSPF